MSERIRGWLFDPIIARLVIVALGILIIVVVVRTLSRSMADHLENTDTRYRVRKLVGFGGYLLGALLVTTVYSRQMAGFTVAFGVAGAGIAFALQEVIASAAGWLALTFSNFYAPGDRIQLGGIKGDVIDISVLRTTLMEVGDWVKGDLYNGRIVRVANSFVFKEPVFNYSGDFPFLWDELTVPVRFGSDRILARQLIEDAVQAVVGEYTASAQESWQEMLRKYRLEAARIEPMVTLVANDNWMEYTVRYVCDFKRRRATKDALFERILDAVDGSDGKVMMASATFELVAAPDLRVTQSTRDAG